MDSGRRQAEQAAGHGRVARNLRRGRINPEFNGDRFAGAARRVDGHDGEGVCAV